MPIIWKKQDGSIAVTHCAPGVDETAEAARLIEAGNVQPGWVAEVGASIPAERTFRNAWGHPAAGAVVVNMPQAREIWRDKMRQVRGPLLVALDAEYMKADEAGNAASKAAIAAQKQALRDVTADAGIDAAQTPEELRMVWPEVLGDM